MAVGKGNKPFSLKSQVLLIAFFVFLFSHSLHILIWRFGRPRNDAIVLAFVFLAPLFILPLLAGNIAQGLNAADFAAICLLQISLACAYIQIYPASQAQSPSLKIMMIVESGMPAGVTEEQIRKSFRQESLFDERLDDLLLSGLVEEVNGRLQLTARGRQFITPFLMIRKAVGLPFGEG